MATRTHDLIMRNIGNKSLPFSGIVLSEFMNFFFLRLILPKSVLIYFQYMDISIPCCLLYIPV